MHPALVAAILHLIPNAFPLLPPCERAAAGEANFLREMLLFNALHDLIWQEVKLPCRCAGKSPSRPALWP